MVVLNDNRYSDLGKVNAANIGNSLITLLVLSLVTFEGIGPLSSNVLGHLSCLVPRYRKISWPKHPDCRLSHRYCYSTFTIYQLLNIPLRAMK